jgi:hypothetical protein
MSTYYVYSAEGKHDYLGTLDVTDRDAGDLTKLLAKARKSFRVANIRVDCTRKTYSPPRGRVRVAPNVARRLRPA